MNNLLDIPILYEKKTKKQIYCYNDTTFNNKEKNLNVYILYCKYNVHVDLYNFVNNVGLHGYNMA